MKAKKTETTKRRTSLITVLLASICFTISFFNFFQTFFVARNARLSIEENSTENYMETVAGYARSIEKDIESIMNSLDYYVNADIIAEGDFDYAGKWISEHGNVRNPVFDYVMLIDASGISYNDNGTRTNVSERDYFKEVVFNGKESFIDNPVLSKTTGEYVVHFSRAVKAGGKRLAVVGVVTLNNITKEINEIRFGTGAYGWLMTSDGTVMAHKISDFIMKKNFIAAAENDAELSQIAARMTKGESGWGTIKRGISEFDLVCFRPISGTPWSFAISIPADMIYKLISKIRSQMIFGSSSSRRLILPSRISGTCSATTAACSASTFGKMIISSVPPASSTSANAIFSLFRESLSFSFSIIASKRTCLPSA